MNISVTVSPDQALSYLNDSRASLLAKEFTGNAVRTGTDRVVVFDARLVSALDEIRQLAKLADPGYQVVLNRSRLSAGATEREADADLLLNLMKARAERPGRLVRASVERAVEIVDDIDDQALEGLTFFAASSIVGFNNGNLQLGLGEWATSLDRFPHARLPSGANWLEHLHILGAIRLDTSRATTLRPFAEWFGLSYPGFLAPGFSRAKGDEIDQQVQEIYPGDEFYFVEHELKKSVLRLAYQGPGQVRKILEAADVPPDKIDELLELLRAEGGLGEIDEALKAALIEKIREYPVLSILESWRDQIPHPPNITHVGWALAYANFARFFDGPLAPLDAWLGESAG